MKTDVFDFVLPEDRIAQFPPQKREMARLLFVERKKGARKHKMFSDILEIFGEKDVLVFNRSRVIPARIPLSQKSEIFLSEKISENIWLCLVKPGKKFSARTSVSFPDESYATVLSVRENGLREIHFTPKEKSFSEFLDQFGQIPLPPYIKRKPEELDANRYQTVFADIFGSIAAPTAGLHFTNDILEKLKQKGAQIEFVTLHVGLGTFLPVKTDDIENHVMHQEYYEIAEETAQRLNTAKSEGKQITAIGSTSLRTLESAANKSGILQDLSGKTGIFLYPPAEFYFTDHFFTNFHLPKSTLLMLLSAFASPKKTSGTKLVLDVYREAIEQKYRFFSYGDATLWW